MAHKTRVHNNAIRETADIASLYAFRQVQAQNNAEKRLQNERALGKRQGAGGKRQDLQEKMTFVLISLWHLVLGEETSFSNHLHVKIILVL